MTSRTLIALACLLLSAPAARSAGLPEPRLVRVSLNGTGIERLLGAGLDVIEVHRGDYAMVLEWPQDHAKIASLGLPTELVDDHPGRTAAIRARDELSRMGIRQRPPSPEGLVSPGPRSQGLTAPPFGNGSMGGYWTAAEIKMKLDDLVATDTHDIVANKIDTVGTSREGRPIWGLEIGKHVAPPDTRPVVFYNAITHAREPGGMQTLLYFIDNLLSGYGTDPFATYLLDHRRIYIVPLVNPDGYRINEQTYFSTSSFGLWRKNTRDNDGNGTFDSDSDGVDLNRNYGVAWGLDNIGSSPDPTNETYRGPSAFSEPESRVQRDLVASMSPKTGLSFHSSGDLMLHAWGYTTTRSLDAAAFHEWNDLLTRSNAYQSGQSPDVLYTVNGEFNDWCYGDTTLKPRAFTWTPELGSGDDGFYPPVSRFVPLGDENLRACYVVAAIAGAYVQEDGWSILEGALNASYGAHLFVKARNVGAGANAGPGLVGTCTPLDAGIRMLSSTVGYPSLGPRQSANPSAGASFEMVVDDTITPGRPVRFQITWTDPSGLFSRDTLTIPLGTPTVLFTESASGALGQWTISPAGTWGPVQDDPGHPSRYLNDSPAGDYTAGVNAILSQLNPVNLSPGVHAYAVFDARWEFESDDDAGLIEGSLNGTTWQLLKSTGSSPGSGVLGSVQVAGQPYFAGTRWMWKTEWADLSGFTGPAGASARIRFRTRSNGSGNYDGLSIDSIRVLLYDPAAQPALVAVDGSRPPRLELASPLPNPASVAARFEFAIPAAQDVRLDVLDVQGRIVRPLVAERARPGRYVRGWDLMDPSGRRAAPGVYFVRLATESTTLTKRFVLID